MGADYPQQGWVQYAQAAQIAARLAQRYAAGEVDEVVLVYSEFVSAITQRPREVRLLPFALPSRAAGGDEARAALRDRAEPAEAAGGAGAEGASRSRSTARCSRTRSASTPRA